MNVLSFFLLVGVTSLPAATKDLYQEAPIFRDEVDATWLPDGNAFWYHVATGPQRSEFVLIDALSGKRRAAASLRALGLQEKETAPTLKELAESLRSGPAGEETRFRIQNFTENPVEIFWINHRGERVHYASLRAGDERQQPTFVGHVWLVENSEGAIVAVKEIDHSALPLIIGDKENGSKKRSRKNRFPSPDRKHVAFVEIEKVPTRKVTLVDSYPADQVQPKTTAIDYPKPGDPLPRPQWVVEDSAGYRTPVPTGLYPNPYTLTGMLDAVWAPHGEEFYFDYNERGHQLYRILSVNAASGETRVVVEETSETFIDYRNKTWRHWFHDRSELLWMSERDGWAHLWLYDVKSGTVKRQITQGQWVVREVLRVDESKREVWFLASGLRQGEDPYHLHLCRVQLDTGEIRQLTQSDGNHQITFSPDHRFFIAKQSRVDRPAVHELRRSDDGSLVSTFEKSDISALLATGWKFPERFVAKGRDGATDIHGVIIKPRHFNPSKRYPVVEEIYAGPQSAYAPKSFSRLARMQAISDLGFVVVKLDGMGTNHRGKAFHQVSWKNLKDAGFPDRKLWIRAAAATRPWMDLSRVGIYGGSAGGQNALRALLDHHDFYHVAVADCGCHDNRVDKIWWNEQWMGWPIGDHYAANSNVEDAHKLKGHLLLTVGEVDANVDPASTLQVVGALQKAGKSFEFMPIIGVGHGAGGTPYAIRLRNEFLIKHLSDTPIP